jgi:FixJ family two-component response regulator
MNDPKPTVFVVDDEASMRKGLTRLLTAAGFRVETFPSSQEFLRRPLDESLCCALFDVQMPGLNGLELQETLAACARPLPIIFITGHGDIPTSVRAMRAGAIDFLSKPFDEKDLLGAIARALEKGRGDLDVRAQSATAVTRLATLTPREHEVLLHVLRGELNKQIADALGASEKTIKVHRGRVMHKMQVQSVADLVRLCEKAGIRIG